MSFFRPIPQIDYRKCVLTESQKGWYISYYVKDPMTQKLKRVRFRFNGIADIRQRRRTAREVMSAIDQRLVLGWNPFTEHSAPRAFETLYAAFDSYLEIKGKEMEESSLRTYNCVIKNFKNFLVKYKVDENSYACCVDSVIARRYMDNVETKYSPKSYNNQLATLGGVFRWMKTKGFVPENPFDGIEKKSKKIMHKNRRMLNDEELHDVIEFLKENNTEYLAMTMLCYCCFLRPKEIALLRCSDIDLEHQVVRVSEEIAKNDHTSYRTIPDNLMPVMRKLDLTHPTYYLFGQHKGTGDFRPSPKQVCSRKIAKWWDQHVRPACSFGMDIKFYSLKDTGITNMLTSGVPINLVQQQADHSSVAMTAIYVSHKNSAEQQIKSTNILDLKK